MQIDYDKFAENAGFKNANTAATQWYGLKKKLDKARGGASKGEDFIVRFVSDCFVAD